MYVFTWSTYVTTFTDIIVALGAWSTIFTSFTAWT